MRSATVTAALWFLVGVAVALGWTSLWVVTLPFAVVLAVVVLRRGLRDRWLWSTALIGAAVVFLFFGVRQWGVPGCSGGNSDTGSVTIRPGESAAESRCGGLPATPMILVAILAGTIGVGGLVARSVFTTTRAFGEDT
jgi:hypothetical protein